MKPKRMLIKITGESLGDENGEGLNPENAMKVAKKLKILVDEGIQLAILPGGGNIFRWKDCVGSGMERVPADQCGRLGGLKNGVLLQDALERMGVYTRLMSSIEIPEIAESYIIRRAQTHLRKGRVIIIVGGIGPYFTHDSAAAIRASEIGCDLLAKASTVDGVYDKDPKKFPDAVKIDHASYREMLDKKLAVMDLTAFTICEENQIPIMIFNAEDEESFRKIARGEQAGSIISDKK